MAHGIKIGLLAIERCLAERRNRDRRALQAGFAARRRNDDVFDCAVVSGICAGLGFLGLALDRRRNAKNAPLISTDAASVTIRVIRTDEELMVARSVCRLLRLNGCD